MPVSKPVLVIGSINMDLVARTPRIAGPGETLIGSGFDTTPGGKGANQAVAVARLGHPVTMLGAVGEDVFGQALLQNLQAAGVDTSATARVSGPSGIAQIQVADDGQNSIVVVPGANASVSTALIDREAHRIAHAGIVLLQLEIPMETIAHVVELCRRAGVPIMLDPAPAAPLPSSLWPHIAWFTPNETEVLLYTQQGSQPHVAEAAAAELLAKGVGGAVLKRGTEGALVATSDSTTSVPAFSVRAVDTVAAGDCFNGAFAVGLMEGRTPADAARFASAAAALSVTRRGAQASMPTRGEVDAFLASRP